MSPVHAPAAPLPAGTGVLLMAHGGPASLDDVPTFLERIRGKPPAPELVAVVQDRYRQIGGRSPLADRTAEQAMALERVLGVPVAHGFRHAAPGLQDGLRELASRGVVRVVAIPLAPQQSGMTIGAYHHELEEARAGIGRVPEVLPVGSWAREPLLHAALAECALEGIARVPDADPAAVWLVMTAHSLPRRVAEAGDPYPTEVRATAEGVATLLPGQRWVWCYQSAGMTPEPWLGPDVAAVIRNLAEGGEAGACVCPVGFVADHVEVLYDLDIALAEKARGWRFPIARAPALNARPAFIAALSHLVRTRLAEAGAP